MSVAQDLAEHLSQYPNCTEATCPHTKKYIAKVIFVEPDNGFLATVAALGLEQAKRVVREGVAWSHPQLTVKSIEVDTL